LDTKVWQIYPISRTQIHIQGLDIELGFTFKSGLWGTRYQTFKPSHLTHFADISALGSSPILEGMADKSKASGMPI